MNFPFNKLTFALFLTVTFLFSNILLSQNWNLQNSGTIKKLNSVSVSGYTSWICGDSGTILKTTNNGTNWINQTGNGIPQSVKLICIFSHKKYFPDYNDLRYAFATGLNSAGSYIYMTSNGGNNWSLVHSVLVAGARLNSIWFKDTLNGFAEGEPIGGRWQLWKTTNRGVNWDSTGLYLNGSNYSGFSNNMCGKYNSYDSTLYIGANYNLTESKYFYSSNFGRTWGIITPGINHPMTSIYFISISQQNIVRGLLGGNKYFSISSNGGSNWSTYDSSTFTSTQVCQVTDGYYSGPSFILATDSLGRQIVYTAYASNYYYVSMSGLKGINHINGYNWVVYMVGDSGKVYFKGILYPLVKNEGSIISDKFSLSQNYPNPFNPSTIIRFQIKDLRFVTLKVYNILGKEIATLVNEKLQPGEFETTFDARLSGASSLPSGVYFYKLQAGDFKETKKMLLIK